MLFKMVGQQASIPNCPCDQLWTFSFLTFPQRTLDSAASRLNMIMWTINWPFLRPVVMIENKRLSPAQSTISNQTLYTDKITHPFSTSDLQGRSLLDRVTAHICSTPYCYHPTGKPLNAFHDRPPRKHSDVSDDKRLQSHSSTSLQGKRAFSPTSYRYTCPW